MNKPPVSPDQPRGVRRLKLPEFDGRWITFIVALPNELIQHVCVIFEGYDNLTQVRTPIKQGNRIHITLHADGEETVRRILAELSTTVPLEIVEITDGFPGMMHDW